MPEADVGVPGALVRALRELGEQVGRECIAELWVFPPFRNGRRETGVAAAGCFTVAQDGPPETGTTPDGLRGPGSAQEPGGGSGRRLLVTLAYRSEETGEGIAFSSSIQEEGEAPQDRLPRIMEGVVHRLANDPEDPRRFEVAGDPDRFDEVLAALDEGREPIRPGIDFHSGPQE